MNAAAGLSSEISQVIAGLDDLRDDEVLDLAEDHVLEVAELVRIHFHSAAEPFGDERLEDVDAPAPAAPSTGSPTSFDDPRADVRSR